MDMDVASLIKVLGVVGVMAVQTWALVRYMLDRMDKLVGDERKERLEMIEKLYEKVNVLSGETVKREEFNTHVNSMRNDSQNLLTMLNNLGQAINTRLDGVLLMLAKGNQDVQPK